MYIIGYDVLMFLLAHSCMCVFDWDDRICMLIYKSICCCRYCLDAY